tara:strand:- start:436 stop:825 length:390 start_codon:yes stop_codon:yes gene_type:complete
MALTSKKYSRIFSETGSDGDLITADEKALMKKEFDDNTYIDDKDSLNRLGPVLYKLQLITEELDYLRTEIDTNKAKTPIATGANTVVSFGDMVSTTVKGKTTYSIVMTVAFTDPVSSKVTTKSTTLTLI